MQKLLALVFIFFTLHTTSFSQISTAGIDSLVNYAMSKFKVAGCAVAVVKDNKVVYSKGFGVRSITSKLPVDANTNFQIASNSKAFTTAALSILIDEGKIKWTDKVKTYLPEFKLYNEYVTENFIIEDLLCHRSGLGLGAGDLMDFPDGTDFTIQDKLKNLQYFEPVSAFRTKFDYDNQLYIIAGELIARVSGMSWEQFIQTKILAPLGMTNSYAALRDLKDRSNMATAHSATTGTIRPIGWFDEKINGAAGGVVSNVNDISKWMMMQLNRGKYGANLEKQIFSPARQREMWTIHTVTGINGDPRYNQHFAGYGLGWSLSDMRGNMMADHTGGLPGMLTAVCLIPDQKLGIVVLTNTENDGGALFSAVRNSIVDSYISAPTFPWVDRFASRMGARASMSDSVTNDVWKAVAAAKNTKVDASTYIGVYEDKWFGKAEVFMKGNQLWFKCYRSPKLNGPMQFYKANSFAIKWEYQDMNCDAFAIFSLDEEGKAEGIRMKGISPDIDFSFDFQDLNFKRVK